MTIYCWLGVKVALPDTCKAHFIQHGQLRGSKQILREWYVVWFAVTWNIWWCRNQLVFKKIKPQWDSVVNTIQLRSWHWLKALRPDFSASLSDWFQQYFFWL
jgi:hypothetical protein